MKKLQDEYDKEIVAICPLCEKKTYTNNVLDWKRNS